MGGPKIEPRGGDSEEGYKRIEYHVEKALERSENDESKYHLREALGLLRI